jgi:fructosamine-3-kinase
MRSPSAQRNPKLCCRNLNTLVFVLDRCAGFSGSFWAAYHEVIPRAPGFEDRHQLYQLYHYLNHYNLFGSGELMSLPT